MKYTDEYINDISKVIDIIPSIKDLKNACVLITGAGGLICSSIVDVLLNMNKNISVYAADINEEATLKRFEIYKENEFFHYFKYNVNIPLDSNIDFDYIIHGASPASPNMYMNYPVETMMANFMGTKYLLDYGKKHKCKRFLYISSSEVYGNKENNKPYVEDDYYFVDILNTRSCYPSAKRAAETLCVSYSKEYNIDAVIVRPGHVYGPTMTKNDTRAASQFARDVVEGHDIIMKSMGTQLRSHCYVLDCVSAILTVLLNGKESEAYNISNPNSVSTIRDIAESYAKAGGRKVIFEVATFEELNSFNMMNNSSLDSTKLEKLGWEGLFTLDEGVAKTLTLLNFNQ